MKRISFNWLNFNIIAWLLVSLFAVLSIWQLWYYLQYGKVSSESKATQFVTPGANSSINRERIRTSAYFGQYLPEDGKGIQQANLDFVLVGVLYSENPKNSQVIIRQSNQEEKSYHINDTLPGGAVVKKITESSVIVLFDGKLQQLSLPKYPLTFEAKPKAELMKERM